MFYNFIFPQRFNDKGVSFLLLIVRLFFGTLFLIHGIDKMINFDQILSTFPDVLGFGSYMSLMVSIFCEFCCSLFLMSGLLTRLVAIPMTISMAVAFFVVHDAILPDGELALIYLVVFLIIFITGSGRYSLDYLIDSRFRKERSTVN